MNLIDADIVVDLLRGFPPASQWIDSLSEDRFLIPGIVAMQILEGSRDRRELQIVQNFLRPHKFLWPKRSDFRRAVQRFGPIHLKHGTDAFDALIAETAIGADLPLHTFNIKHFVGYPELVTIQPYSRTKNA